MTLLSENKDLIKAIMRQKNIIIHDLNVRYYQSEEIEKNNALIFLHGWGSEAILFQKTLEKCKSFMAIDLPGFGNSELPKTAWSLSDYASFLKDFLEKLEIDKPILAGHSFGGSIAIKYSAQGNTLKKLILIDSAGIRKKTIKKFIYYIVAKFFKIAFVFLPGVKKMKQNLRKKFYKVIDSEDYLNSGKMVEIFRKTISEDLKYDLKRINVPTTLIWGENDKDTPLEDGKLMHKLIKDSKLFIVSNAGHYVFLDNTKAFNEIFLAQIQ